MPEQHILEWHVLNPFNILYTLINKACVIGFGLPLFWPGVDIDSESQTIDITSPTFTFGPILY